MILEKNPIARNVFRHILRLEDMFVGRPFPKMERSSQTSVYACGPATLQMLFSFVGVKVSQTGITRSIRAQNKIKLYGIDVDDMARAAKIAGKGKFVFWRKNNATIGDLDKVINKYHFPVGVEWQGVFYENEDEDDGHYGVITKVNRKTNALRIADPYFFGYFKYGQTDRKFKISEFTKKWWDSNMIGTKEVVDRKTMFVITPKKDTWPSKLGMKRVK